MVSYPLTSVCAVRQREAIHLSRVKVRVRVKDGVRCGRGREATHWLSSLRRADWRPTAQPRRYEKSSRSVTWGGGEYRSSE